MIRLLPKLTAIVKVNGRITDSKFEECMGHLIPFDEGTRKADDCALNHGRCLWTSDEKVIEAYNEKQIVEAQKIIDIDNKAME